jgi:aspartate/methionine/tyrosine aminotransferase
VREYADLFSLLDHLNWARTQRGPHRHHLASSAVPIPPSDIFDPNGPVVLDIQLGAEDEMIGKLCARYAAPREEILLTAGVSEGLYVAAAALLDPGDVAVVETPRYGSLAGVPRALGAQVVDLLRTGNGTLERASIRESFQGARDHARGTGSRVAAVFLADPHNPTGRRLDGSTLDAIAEEATAAGAVVVLDEVYRDLDEERPIGSARVRHPEWITLNSLTKSYGLGGLRFGWLQAPAPIRERARRVQLHLSVLPSAPSVGVALRAVDAADRILAWARPRIRENRARLAEALADRPGGFEWTPEASAAAIAFPRRPSGPDTLAEAQAWARERKLAVIPGVWFGEPSGVRVGLGGDPAAFAAALATWLDAVRVPTRAAG